MVNKGRKIICKNCDGKFYTLGKTKDLKCPICKTEYNLDEDLLFGENIAISELPKNQTKDEFVDVENNQNTSEEDEDIISLEDAVIEEESDKN